MKLKGTVINGIFQLVEGVVFTRGDFLINNSELYIVLNDYDGSVPPEESDACIDYISYHEYSNSNNGDTSIVTARVLQQLINSYIKGLTSAGCLENIVIHDITELDLYKDVAVYNATINEEYVGIIPSGSYIMKVFKTDSDTIQEFDDYKSGYIYYRSIKSNEVTVVPSKSIDYDAMQSKFKSISNKLINLVRTATAIKLNQVNFQKIDLYNDNGLYVFYGIEKNTILNTIIEYEYQNQKLQYNINIYLTSGTDTYVHYLNETDYATITYDGSVAKVKFNKTGYALVKAFISKGN